MMGISEHFFELATVDGLTASKSAVKGVVKLVET